MNRISYRFIQQILQLTFITKHMSLINRQNKIFDSLDSKYCRQYIFIATAESFWGLWNIKQNYEKIIVLTLSV